jgi:hypothetical protein
MPHTLGDDESVAAEDDRDVVMPPWKRAAFEVVEAELALELFVGPFGSPALFDDAHDLLLRQASRQSGEHGRRGRCRAGTTRRSRRWR